MSLRLYARFWFTFSAVWGAWALANCITGFARGNVDPVDFFSLGIHLYFAWRHTEHL